MPLRKTLLLFVFVWASGITALHCGLNLRLFDSAPTRNGVTLEKFGVGFLPVTCHLTCPVTDFINKSMTGDNLFQPMRFSGFPELKEMFLGQPKKMPATFILAPMAIALREQGVPLKIVYLGHRDGTAMMVHKDSSIFRIEDLRGKRIAVPGRFANQKLLIYKALRDRNIPISEVTLVEMPPPDMPAALYAKSVDAVTSGEPFMAQTELDGYGRVLYLTKDVWPNFISCVLAVQEDAIRDQRAEIQELVNGIAKSGKWLDSAPEHRMDAAQFVSKNYYYQNPKLLTFVLSKPPDRVKYTDLLPMRKDFEEIEALGKEAGILNGTARFEDYTDTSFATEAAKLAPHEWEGEK